MASVSNFEGGCMRCKIRPGGGEGCKKNKTSVLGLSDKSGFIKD